LQPEAVTAGALTLVHEDAPNRFILCAGAGGFASTRLFETDGVFIPKEEQSPEAVLAQWDGLSDISKQAELESGSKQTEKFLTKAMQYLESQK